MFVTLALAPAMAWGHPLALGLVELTERGGGLVAVSLRVSGTEQQGHAVTLRPPAGCALVGPMSERLGSDAWEASGLWRCPRGLRGATMTVRGLEGSEVQLIARVRLADGALTEARLDDHQRAFAVPPRARASTVAWSYLRMGARHIAEGADHLAFLACLALWVGRARGLVAAVTGFTAGHSVTLALSALGLVQLPQRPVEACIALSVALLALELAHGRPPPRRHALLSAAVGLLHGLGFASALREVGLPQAQRGWALLSFNVGVELGQIVFLAGVLSIGALARRAVGDPSRARRWVVEAVGACSVMWLLQRVMG